jgi:hypothetical protein
LAVLALAVMWPKAAPDAGPQPDAVEAGGGYRCPGCNVVLVSIETTRADHLGAYGYPRNTSPNIDAAAKEGVVFENFFTVKGSTWPSLTSLLTSLYPASTGVRENGKVLASPLPTITSELGREGYVSAAFLSNFCEAGGYGFAEKFCTLRLESEVSDDVLTSDAIEWMRNNSGRRMFLWVHYFAASALRPAQEIRCLLGPRLLRAVQEHKLHQRLHARRGRHDRRGR